MKGWRAYLRDEHALGDFGAHRDVVVSVRHDLRLHDGHKALALADGRIARQVVHALGDCGDVSIRRPLGERARKPGRGKAEGEKHRS